MSVFVFVALYNPSGTYAHDLVFPGDKLKILVPQAESFEQKNLYMSDNQRSGIDETLKDKLPEEDLKPSIYFAVVRKTVDARPRKEAVIIFIDAYGDGGKIEIGVVVGRKGELRKIHIFENNESVTLSQQAFINQFGGKKASDVFMIGEDITSPPGEAISAQAISSGARRGVLIINELLRKK